MKLGFCQNKINISFYWFHETDIACEKPNIHYQKLLWNTLKYLTEILKRFFFICNLLVMEPLYVFLCLSFTMTYSAHVTLLSFQDYYFTLRFLSSPRSFFKFQSAFQKYPHESNITLRIKATFLNHKNFSYSICFTQLYLAAIYTLIV